MTYEDKVALVTGAANGIGEACAAALGANGARVVIADIDVPRGEAVAHAIEKAGGRAAFIRTDAAQEDGVAALVRKAVSIFGRLDCAHNNVGQGVPGATVTDMDIAEWDATINLSLRSTWLAMKYEIPVMLAQGGGAIVNTASMLGLRYSPLSSPAYAAAKAGVIHLSQYASHAYAGRGVRVNSISPGLVVTPLVAQHLTPEQQTEIAAQDQLIARGTTPQEVAQAVLYLLSDAAAMVTGINLPICGGAR